MSDVEIYHKLNKVSLPAKQTRFPYNIEFTKKTIDLVSRNGKVFKADPLPSRQGKSTSGKSTKGGVRIYSF